jgi:hypothetical protein
LLIGTAALGGILLEFNAADAGNDNDDIGKPSLVTGEIIEKKDRKGFGYIEASISWGRNFKIRDGLILKPNLGFAYNFNLQENVLDPGTPGSIETTELKGIDPYFGNPNPGYVDINNGAVGYKGYYSIHAGLEAALLINAINSSIWASYDFASHNYDKQSTDSQGHWKSYNPAYSANIVNLGLGASYMLDRRLSMGWSVESDIKFANAAVTSIEEKNGLAPRHKYSEDMFGIYPKAAIGITSKLLVDILNLNGSIALYPLAYSYRKFKHDVITITTDKNHKINSAQAEPSLGFTWFLTNGLLMDLAASTIIDLSGSRLNLSRLALLLSYKL